jgi:hypothetical protein
MNDATHVPPPDDAGSAELRALYARLQPPPLADEPFEADAETVRVVGWMQQAWRGLAVPPARAPRRARPRPVRRALAAAALLLVVAGAAFLRAWRERTATRPERLAGVGTRTEGVEVLAALPDRLELRSGPVRLVLLEPPPTEPIADRPGS